MNPNDVKRATDEYLAGELTIGCWILTSEGRYQLAAIERSTVMHDGVRIPHVNLTFVREPVVPDRIVIDVVLP